MTDRGTGDVRVISARRLLKSIPDSSISAVILDPPSLFGVDGDEEDTRIDEMIAGLTSVAEQVNRVLIPGGASIFMGFPRSTAAWEVVAAWADLNLAAEITVLWKGDPVGSLSTSIRWHIKSGLRFGVPIVVKVPSNIIVCETVDLMHRYCPTQKPVELFNYLISLLATSRGTILDPFCGTGSSLVAAKMCNRVWIGGDIDEDKVYIARRRLSMVEIEELKPLNLWVEGRLQRVEG